LPRRASLMIVASSSLPLSSTDQGRIGTLLYECRTPWPRQPTSSARSFRLPLALLEHAHDASEERVQLRLLALV
jgi:hypothetical protein